MALSKTINDAEKKSFGILGSGQPNVAHRPKSYDGATGVTTKGVHAVVSSRSRYRWPHRKSGSYSGLTWPPRYTEQKRDMPSPETHSSHDEAIDQPEVRSKRTNASRSGLDDSDQDALEILDSIADLDAGTAGDRFHPQGLQQAYPRHVSTLRSRSPSTAGTERPPNIDEASLRDSSQRGVSEPPLMVDTSHDIDVAPLDLPMCAGLDDARHNSPLRPQSPVGMSTSARQDIDETVQPRIRPSGTLRAALSQSPPAIADEKFSRLIRRLRKRTHEVLIKRTHWRLEYESAQNSRSFLQESTSLLRSALEVRKTDVSHKRIKPKTKRSRRKRQRFIPAAKMTLPKDELVSTSAKDDSDAGTTGTGQDLSSNVGSELTANSSVSMTALFDRYLDDLRALEDQEMKEKKVMEELSAMEFHLEELLTSFTTRMRSATFARDLQVEMMTGSNLSSDSSSHAPSEELLHPLLEEYFQLQGNIGVFLERLGELDYEHTEGLQERDFLRDHLEEVKISDDDFESSYKNTRLHIEQELKDARDKFAIVEEKCRVAGLDPELYRNDHADTPAIPKVPFGLAAKGLLSPKVVGSGAHGPSAAAIDRWLLNVPDEALPSEDRTQLEEQTHEEVMAELQTALQSVEHSAPGPPPL